MQRLVINLKAKLPNGVNYDMTLKFETSPAMWGTPSLARLQDRFGHRAELNNAVSVFR